MTTTAYQPTRTRPTTPVALVAGGALLTAVAAFLPWQILRAVFLGQVTVTGMEGDGRLTLAAAVLTAGMAFWRHKKPLAADRAASIVAGLAGLGVMAVAAYDIVNVTGVEDTEGVSVAVGPGLWLTAIAACLVVVGAVLDVTHALHGR